MKLQTEFLIQKVWKTYANGYKLSRMTALVI